MKCVYRQKNFNIAINVQKRIRRLAVIDDADFIIKWRLTDFCNADCSYCLRKEVVGDRAGITQEELKKEEDNLCKSARDISKLLDTTNFNTVKINILGGEVSMFNLERIISSITSCKLKKINLTTNFLRASSYYQSFCFYIKNRGISLTLTASFHPEFQSFDAYFEKIKTVQGLVGTLTCEIVSSKENQDVVRQFISKCKELNLYYKADADLRMAQKDARNEGLIAESNKSENCHYKILFMDGTEKSYIVRNHIFMDNEIADILDHKILLTKGMCCTSGYNYIYILYNEVVGRTNEIDRCSTRTPISKYKLIEPKPCKMHGCTICGDMSLWRD